MKLSHVLAGLAFSASVFAAMPSTAQVQLNLCGVPPLPPCQPQVQERVIIERERPVRGERLSNVCRTRTLRCRIDEPRPSGSRCTCEDENGEDVVGRIR